MKQYPTPEHLSALLRILVRVTRHEGQRVPVLLDELSTGQRQKMFWDVPMYCDSAVLKPCIADTEASESIALFRAGKTKEDLQAMERIVSIVLDREEYEKQPFNEKWLANVLSEFLWHFKGRLDYGIWQLLEQHFDLSFVVLKDDLPVLQSLWHKIIDDLQTLSGPVPFYPLEKTQRFIRGKLREYSPHHTGIVSLKRSILEEQLCQAHDLQHGEYIPFYESLFVSWSMHGLPLLDAGPEVVSFKAMNVAEGQGIMFDEHESKLHIREKIVKITKHKSQWNLLRVLAKDRESQEKDWQFSEFKELIDREQKDKDFYNAANQLRLRLQREGIADFLLTTSHSVQINPRYLEAS